MHVCIWSSVWSCLAVLMMSSITGCGSEVGESQMEQCWSSMQRSNWQGSWDYFCWKPSPLPFFTPTFNFFTVLTTKHLFFLHSQWNQWYFAEIYESASAHLVLRHHLFSQMSSEANCVFQVLSVDPLMMCMQCYKSSGGFKNQEDTAGSLIMCHSTCSVEYHEAF